jgi:hypothetical protein
LTLSCNVEADRGPAAGRERPHRGDGNPAT